MGKYKYLKEISQFTLADLKLSKADFTKWIAALRSGDYYQCRSSLHIGNAFCCLGVLCDVTLVTEGKATWERVGHPSDNDWMLYPLNGSFLYPVAGVLPKGFAFEDDSVDSLICTLASANDGGATFEEIAEALESHFLPMFD